jgi:hypothetical protein
MAVQKYIDRAHRGFNERSKQKKDLDLRYVKKQGDWTVSSSG